MKRLVCLLLIVYYYPATAQKTLSYDVCVYGATSGGVIAAYTASMHGKTVVIVEPGKHIGGLSSGGLGFTDIGNKYAVTGLGLDFYRRTGLHYGKFESWIFEPHVASKVFSWYISKGKIPVMLETSLLSVVKTNGIIKEIVVGNKTTTTIAAKVFIDCSYEGDLMAGAAVSYTTGREGNEVYKETFNGTQVHRGNQFPDSVSPYRIPGDASSGLLWGISNEKLPAIGSGDKKIQAYNFRICLSNDPANSIPITRPENYDSLRYELLLREIARIPNCTIRQILKLDIMPNHKVDINNNGGFSTDMIGMNWNYPEGDGATRKKIWLQHKEYDQGFLYFIGHDPRVPELIRKQMLEWGYPKDEYVENDHWSPQLYIREARRMKGEYVMTQANCEAKEIVTDGIGMAAYGMDSHNTDRFVINGMVKNEGDVQRGVAGPYPIAYRAITPKKQECRNLLVPVCVSASHIAYGSIRMEPVFMVLSQSAATAAVIAINEKKAVQEIDVKKLQRMLSADPLADGSKPEMVIDDQDKTHVSAKGAWAFQKGDGYGPGYSFVMGDSLSENTFRFIPEFRLAGKYKVYTYILPRLKNAAAEFTATVFNGNKAQRVTVRKSDIQLSGQTSGEWFYLGSFDFRSGSGSYVELSDKGSTGIVAADAVLLVPESVKK
jgi:ribulose 1,5-bisphosphate synthetase/thiazole synthase